MTYVEEIKALRAQLETALAKASAAQKSEQDALTAAVMAARSTLPTPTAAARVEVLYVFEPSKGWTFQKTWRGLANDRGSQF